MDLKTLFKENYLLSDTPRFYLVLTTIIRGIIMFWDFFGISLPPDLRDIQIEDLKVWNREKVGNS
jgi:hypothetical protein